MLSEMIGRGRVSTVQISVEKEIIKVRARVGLFGSTLGVFTEGNFAGRIAVPFWENQIIYEIIKMGEKPVYTKETLIYQVVESIFHALRQTYHILYSNYGISFQYGEKKHLQEAIAAIERLNLFALGLRQKTIETDKELFQRRVEAIFGQISLRPRDQRKKEVVTYLKQIGWQADRELLINPAVIRTRTIAAKIRLQDIVNDILSIEQKIVARRQVLISIIEYIELHLKGARHFLNLLLKEENWQSFIKSDLTSRKKVQDQLTFFMMEFEKIDIEPFAFSCRMIVKEFREAREAIKEGNYDLVRKLLSTSRESLKRRAIRTDLERVIMKITLYLTPQRKTKPFDWQRTIGQVRELVQRLKGVDEKYFVKPACREALIPLNVAFAFLKPQKVSNLEMVREYLKEAAQPL